MIKNSLYILILFILIGIFIPQLVADETVEQNFGNLTFKDGAIYRGEHISGVPNGEGVYVSSEGIVMKGTFKDGKLYGHGMFIEEVEMRKGVFPYKGFQIMVGIFIENLKISKGAIIRSTPNMKNFTGENQKGSIVMYEMKDDKEIFDIKSKIINW